MYKVIYSENSKKNIIEIINFIWNLNYIKVINSIRNIISLLENNPEMWVEIVKWEREIVLYSKTYR